MRMGIYAIESKGAGKIYIGSALNLTRRLWQHNTDLRRGCHANPHLQRVNDKHHDLEFVVLEKVHLSLNVIKREQSWLDSMFALAPQMMLNLCRVAGSNAGRTWKMNPEGAQRAALARTGLTRSDETKARMSKAQKGRVVSDETREKNRQVALQRWQDSELRNRYVESATERTLNRERDEGGRFT